MQNRVKMDYMKLDFAIHQDSVTFTRTKKGTYNCSLTYDSKGPAFISSFTHVSNNVDSIHGITQAMKVNSKGSEIHLQTKPGTKAEFTVKDLTIDVDDDSTFLKKID